jgi:hypothetical protein
MMIQLLRDIALTLMLQLSIGLHESMYAKRIRYPLFGLRIRNVCHKLKTDVSDQTPKGQTGVRLITNL